jgi:rhodanese-related sulfurtransferase
MTQTIQALSSETAQAAWGYAVFIDVRETFELASGKIPDARHIPLGMLLAATDTIAGIEGIAKDTPLVVYCQHGVRSLTGAAHLQALGYHQVAHLAGGIVQWQGERV